MPYKKRYRTKRKSTLSKAQVKQVKAIANKAIDDEIEDKSFVYLNENVQLIHNKPLYLGNFLADIQQGP